MRYLLAALLFITTLPAFAADKLNWNPWSDDVFARAKKENKFVLLDLEAVWCHWCHVMDETTYQDPATIALLKSKYILVRVDQDSRPDLSNRYEDYGWPATVVFDAKGHEIVKRQGYIPPRQMASMLKAIIDDPTPGPSVVPEKPVEFLSNALLSPSLRTQLEKTYLSRYDSKEGSWGFDQKFLDWDAVEYAMALARKGDKNAEHMALQTLDAQLNLIDPAWGGVYQYSTGGNWKEPHFEKILQFQAANLRIYSLAYEQWRNPVYLKAALNVWRFLDTFLTSADGAFYTSMNADLVDGEHSAKYFQLDDVGRRKLGIPRIDRHVYARENGWVIEALGRFMSPPATTHIWPKHGARLRGSSRTVRLLEEGSVTTLKIQQGLILGTLWQCLERSSNCMRQLANGCGYSAPKREFSTSMRISRARQEQAS